MNIRKLLINLLLFIVISIIAASVASKKPEPAFLNTVFTISGIMFSIGMGVLSTLSPDRIKNENFYKAIQKNIISVRNSYLLYFGIIALTYLAYQMYPDVKLSLNIKKIEIILSLDFAAISLSILGILYFIMNFIEIQRLNFDISDKTRDIK